MKFIYINDLENALINGKGKGNNFYENEDIPIKEWLSNWDFKKVSIDLFTHKIHKYPAMFIPQLTRKLIQKFSEEGDTILDIFCGSGTLLVESKLLNRNSIGIELNPLALLISKVKTTPLNLENVITNYEYLIDKFFDDSAGYDLLEFKNIDFWYKESSIKSISKLIYYLNKIKDDDLQDFLKISLSEILREVSVCKHSGFKMHKDPAKEKKEWYEKDLFDYFHRVFIKNLGGLVDFQRASEKIKSNCSIINGDSRKIQKAIKKNSVDLIITSPPYGDSHTTVAYGQFSRLSAQCLGLGKDLTIDVSYIDNELLGGTIKGIDIDDEVMLKSITLKNVRELFIHRLNNIKENVLEHKKLLERFKDVVSFYKDLDLTIKNASYYLKNDKFFILITGSRIVKEVKLHTDIIIAELADHYGFELKSILYRNIINKRMPSKVSATNIVGEKSATMTRESIVILQKK